MYLVRQTGPLPKMCLFCKPNYTRSYEDGRRVFDIPLTNVYGPHFYFSWLVQTCDILLSLLDGCWEFLPHPD